MCLRVDEQKTKKIKKSRTGWQTVWKIYRVVPRANNTVTVYPALQIVKDSIIPGVIVSDRPAVSYPLTRMGVYSFRLDSPEYTSPIKIYSGIHVSLTRKAARKYKKELETDYPYKKFVMFRCVAHMSDFVAAGTALFITTNYEQAVFKRISVSQTDFDRALKGDFR